MAESKAESRIRELETASAAAELEASYFEKLLEETRGSTKSMERELAEVRQQNALLLSSIEEQRKRLDELQSRLDKWDTRLWGLTALMIAAALSLSAGLIVALVKR